MAKTQKDWYLRGYEEGLREAWGEVARMAARGHTAKEIQLYIRSRKAAIQQDLRKKEMELAREIADSPEPTPYSKPREDNHILDRGDGVLSRGDGARGGVGDVLSRGDGAQGGVDSMSGRANSTLGKAELTLKRGYSYLVNENKPERSYDMMNALKQEGHGAICVTRTHPNQVRDLYDVGETKVIWLTKNEGRSMSFPSGMGVATASIGGEDDRVAPGNLTRLTTILLRFLRENEDSGGVILFDGLEYLITQNEGFQRILKFIQYINEHVAEHGGYLLLPAGEGLDQQCYGMLKKELAEEVR